MRERLVALLQAAVTLATMFAITALVGQFIPSDMEWMSQAVFVGLGVIIIVPVLALSVRDRLIIAGVLR